MKRVGLKKAFIEQVGDPSRWAHEYYTALATGQVGQDRFSLYTGLTRTKGGTYGNDVGTSLKLSIPDVSKQVQKGSEERFFSAPPL